MSRAVNRLAKVLKPKRISGLGISKLKLLVRRVPVLILWHSHRSMPRKKPSNSQTTSPGARSITRFSSTNVAIGTFTTNRLRLPTSVLQGPTGVQTSMGFSQRCIRSSSVKVCSTCSGVAAMSIDWVKVWVGIAIGAWKS